MQRKTAAYIVLSAAVVVAATTAYYFVFLYEAAGIKPPLALQIPYDTLHFRAENGLQYHHTTGSNIQIPKDAFVDADGAPVRGEVTLLYREFHTAEDILLSGIPMGSMDDAQNRALQSAGMFEMKAFSGTEELQLGNGKAVSMQLAAFRNSQGYSIFQLNEDFKWDEKDAPARVANEQKQKDCAALPHLPDKPLHPGIEAGDRIIDLDADYYDHGYLRPFKDYRWKLVEHPANEKVEPWMFRLNWDRVKIEQLSKKQNLFRLTFSSNQLDYENRAHVKKCSVIATPVLTGADLEKALAEFNAMLKIYEDSLAFIQKEEARLALEADVLNAFNIPQLGVWNCDRYVNNPQYVKIKATFDFTREYEMNPYVNKIKVYVINNTDNTVLDYNFRQWDNIYISSGSATSLMAVLPDNRIAVFPQEEFAKVDFNAVYRNGRAYHFNTQAHSADVGDKKRLKELL